MPVDQRSRLRQSLRRQRRQLTDLQQRTAARHLDQHLTGLQLLSRHRDIAFYLASDGEIDPLPFLQRALRMGKRCYLPVLGRGKRLRFVRYRRGDPLIRNRFGIPEPSPSAPQCPPWGLGVVLMPLVGFDRSGARLGMGGGFYDRSFAYTRRTPAMRCPRLIGLAHSCQEVEQLEVESWDIPLTEIVTDKEVIKTRVK